MSVVRKEGARTDPLRFDLAPLTKLDPDLVLPRNGDDRLPSFMLALALVFNDLKGLALFGQWLTHSKPPDGEISGHSGQWRGLDLQIHRLLVVDSKEVVH